MAYTGSDYFMKVKLSGETQSKVRDHDLNDKLAAKGSMLYANSDASGGLASLDTLAIGSSGQVLGVVNGVPAWVAASSQAGVEDGGFYVKVGASGTANKIFSANSASNSTLSIVAGSTAGYLTINNVNLQVPGTGILEDLQTNNITSITNLENKLDTDGFVKDSDLGNGNLQLTIGNTTSNIFSANQSENSGLTFAGSTNGYININGTSVQVANLANYATTDYVNAATNAAVTAANNYTDSKISDLGADIMNFVGAGATLPTAANSHKGDVYVINTGTDAGKEYVFDGSNWVELGSVTETDLNNYVAKAEVIPSLTTGIAIGTIGGKTIYIENSLDQFNNDAGYITSADVTGQVQVDWNQTNSAAVDFIKNKPNLSNFASLSDLNDYVLKSDVTPSLNAGTSLAQIGGKTIYMPTLPTVATSGDYDDLIDKPDLSVYALKTTQIAGVSIGSGISASALSTALGLEGLAFKATASTTITDYPSDVSLTATPVTETFTVVGSAVSASKINSWVAGSATFVVDNGVLSLDYIAPSLSYSDATTTSISVNHNTYSATLTKGNKTITVS